MGRQGGFVSFRSQGTGHLHIARDQRKFLWIRRGCQASQRKGLTSAEVGETSGEVRGTSGEVRGLSRSSGEPDSLPATRQICLQRDLFVAKDSARMVASDCSCDAVVHLGLQMLSAGSRCCFLDLNGKQREEEWQEQVLEELQDVLCSWMIGSRAAFHGIPCETRRRPVLHPDVADRGQPRECCQAEQRSEVANKKAKSGNLQRKFLRVRRGCQASQRKGLTSGEVRETSGEVRGTSGEVWETSGEPLDHC